MTTLARLSLWVLPERRDEFAELFDRRLAPLLARQGLVDPAAGERLQPPDIFSRLFAVDSPAKLAACWRTLEQDPVWQSLLQQLATDFAAGSAGNPLRCRLSLYAAPVTGRGVEAGGGYHQGCWHCFTVQDGLPSSLITGIAQDSQGNLWLRTYNEGVCRFDGRHFTAFTEEDGLIGDIVTCVCADRRGNMWFGAERGACRYDGLGFAHFSMEDGLPHDLVDDIFADSRGDLWFVTGQGAGIARYDGRRFTCLESREEKSVPVFGGIPSHRRIFEDRQGNLWFLLRDGLGRCEGETFVRLSTCEGADQIVSILQDRQGHLWLHRADGSICRCEGNGFKPFALPGGPPLQGQCLLEDDEGHLWFSTPAGLTRYDGRCVETFTEGDGVPPAVFSPVLQDRQGYLWFYITEGLLCWDGFRFRRFSPRDGLGHNRVYAMYQDRGDNLWFGTWGGGLNRYDGHRLTSFTVADGLVFDEVEDICQDRQGNLWFATRGGGVSRFDGRHFKNFAREEGLIDNRVWVIHQDRQGRLWFCTNGGVSCLEGDHFTSFTPADGLAYTHVFSICEDQQGHLWFGTQDRGVSRFDGKTFTTYTTRDGLAHNLVWDICQDRDGHLWFATWNGVSRFDGMRFHTYTARDGLAHDNVWCAHQDRQGDLWFGTWGGGVSRFDGRHFKTFTKEDGLADNNVRHISEDGRGHLWFATYGGGVSRFDGRVFQTLSRKDGLVHDATQAVLQDRDGDLWIATEGGVTRYRPPSSPPAVHLRGVVADRRYEPGEEIALSTAQKLVAFEFQGSSFTTSPERIAYVYRLEGHETQWRTTYACRAEYKNLPTGAYTFQVRAVDKDLNYSAPVQVRCTVTPDVRQDRLEALQAELSQAQGLEQFIGQSAALQQALEQIHTVAGSEVTALILGETGTGKGLAARAIHSLSRRRDQPFIQVNCGAIPEGLVASELFGHEKGAFTGAISRKIGRFELADRGTLFLDEIGDLPLESQRVLLQVLQDGTFQRVGGQEVIQVDVRVVAATNRDLKGAMQQGQFREDLFYRLSGFAVQLPPLRKRQEDIPLLVHHFAEQFARHLNRPLPEIAPAVLDRLQDYAWPGNVRELEHLVQRAILVCKNNRIRLEDLPVLEGKDSSAESAGPSGDFIPLDEQEKQLIQRALRACNWIVYGERGAASLLGVHPERLRAKMRKHGLKRPSRKKE